MELKGSQRMWGDEHTRQMWHAPGRKQWTTRNARRWTAFALTGDESRRAGSDEVNIQATPTHTCTCNLHPCMAWHIPV